jgi:hypothetical protein
VTRLACATIALLVLLAGCGDPPYKGNAEITAHEYDDPDDVWIPGTTYPGTCSGGYGSIPRTCTPGYTTPGYFDRRPERFLLRVQWIDDKGKSHSDTRETSKATYDGCADGRTINLESMQCPPR